MRTWRVINVAAGHLIFGVLAIAALAATAATLARFGLEDSLGAVVLPLAVLGTPWLLWLRYSRHRPTTRRGTFAWSAIASAAAASLLLGPLWFWSVPVLTLLVSEAAWVVTAHRRYGRRRPHPPAQLRTVGSHR